jgi:hypothetical protein
MVVLLDQLLGFIVGMKSCPPPALDPAKHQPEMAK